MPLISCEVNLILTWFKDCVITNCEGEGKLAITETKLYQLKIMQNYFNNYNQNLGLKEQLIGINMNQAQKHMRKIDI